jgi:hypothetical protein
MWSVVINATASRDNALAAVLALVQQHAAEGEIVVDRGGQGGDAEDRVAPHRVASADRLHADRIDMCFAAPTDQRDEARHITALDMTGHDVVHALEPRPGQPSDPDHQLPPSRRIRA